MPHHPSVQPAGAARVHPQGSRTVTIPPIRWAMAASPVQPPMLRAIQPQSTKLPIPPVRFVQASATVQRQVPSASMQGNPGNTTPPVQASFRPEHQVTGAAPEEKGRLQPPPLAPIRGIAAPVQAKPRGVVQRMQVEGKSPWRHLDTAPTNPNWQHPGKPEPFLQIAIGRYVVHLLRTNGIQARLGGSVAALGYCTTRVPDDIDIDILPKHRHVEEAKKELDEATKILGESLIGRLFQSKIGDFSWCHYQVSAVNVASASTFVIALQIDGRLTLNKHNPIDYRIEIEERTCSFKLQIINEAAFTFMNLPKDPGTVAEEKYKEVAGFARLVANCIGRFIQNGGSDSKNDRQRIREMLRAKIASAPKDKSIGMCAKILFYFKDDDEESRMVAAKLLGDILRELNPSVFSDQSAQEIWNAFSSSKVSKLLSALGQTGFLFNNNLGI